MTNMSRIRPWAGGQRIVALGGGHGLSVTLGALRGMSDNLTAVVGVSDDGGSSGRLREEFGIVPPGDMRMALAALCGDDSWGRTWSSVLQHRFTGAGDLAGHAVGNLLIAALWQETDDLVAGLDYVGALLGARGRVLPSAEEPLQLVAEVLADDAQVGDPPIRVSGQTAVEAVHGRIVGLAVEPAEPAACEAAVAAIDEAQLIVLGPGSWFSSVIPHLKVPGIRDAVARSSALRVMVLNIGAATVETRGFAPHTYLEVFAEQAPGVELDLVLADDRAVTDQTALSEAADRIGARVQFERVAARDYSTGDLLHRHDTDLLAAAFSAIMARGRISPWR